MTRDSFQSPPRDPGRQPGAGTGLSGLPRWLAAAFHRLVQWTSPHAALLITLAAGLLPALLLTVGSAELYEAVSESDGVARLDHPVLEAAQALRSPALDGAVTAFTNLAGTVGMPVLALAATAVMTVRWRSWTPVLLVVCAAAGSLLMTVAGKDLVGRARPSLADAVPPFEHSPSFPSGHTLNSVVIAGVVTYLVVLHLRSTLARILTVALAAVFAGAVGLSRVYLGHHWLTDVLVAWTLGLAWLAVVITAHRLLHSARAAEPHAGRQPSKGGAEPDAGP
ncbi:phosphatase PAP2 family protein [Arthrobacter sp. zg-ZUI100]|uniref:phosphatase PAP2 family protein n=1 Tax=Arthrobacter jiangjiafuii TaxID=2817475 RepID=UPI001AEE7C11|nr:phosphatase PAP2 family protein [Arthrobacter jiangjiafuii]MBP3035736.1 phosphatase PAP2 family protein [Arthrobacter jiangjiafuii]